MQTNEGSKVSHRWYHSRLFFNQDAQVRNGWKILGFVFLLAFFSLPFGMLLALTDFLQIQKPLGLVLEYVFLLPPLLFAGGLCTRLEGEAFSSIGLGIAHKRWWIEAGLGIALGMGIMGLCALLLLSLGSFRWVSNPDGNLGFVASGFLVFTGTAFFEEITFRGYAFQRLMRGAGRWLALIIGAMVFAWVHKDNPGMDSQLRWIALLNIGLAGLLLGLAYVRTRSLALPVGLHLGWNWAQGSLLGFGVSGTTAMKGLIRPVFSSEQPLWFHGGAFGLEASLVCTLVTIGACFLLWRWPAKGQVDEFQNGINHRDH